jgi:hypothetical protein
VAWQDGQKAGFCILWSGPKKVGDDFQPETYDLTGSFNIPDYAPGKAAYLQMKTNDVNNNHNNIFINGQKVWRLEPHGREWGFDCIIIRAQFLKKGHNTYKIISRDSSGEVDGNIDDYEVRDPILIYPIE